MNDLASAGVTLALVVVAVLLTAAGAVRARRTRGTAADPAGQTLATGAALLLAALAVHLETRLWATAGDLDLFWQLLIVAAGFGIVARLALPWPCGLAAPHPERAPDTVRAAPALPIGGRRSGLALLGAALLAEVVGLTLFWGGQRLTLAWLLHLAAGVLFLAGLWHATSIRLASLLGGWTRADTLWAAGLTALAFAPRIWRIDAIPQGIWFDEAQRGIEALRMLADRSYRPVFAAGILQEPTGLWYLIAPLVAVLGRDPVALRLPVAVGGALGIGAIYSLARVLYGRRVAVAAAGLAVGLAWHLNFSRIALPAILSLTCDTLAAALFVLGLRRASQFLLGAAGLVLGGGLYFYYTSQLMPFVLAAAAGQQLLAGQLGFVRRNAVGLALCMAGFLLAAGPFAQFALTHPEQFGRRAGTVSVFREVEQAGSWAPLVNNVRAHLLMFHVRGDPNGRHNWSGRPMLDPVSGGLAAAGLGLALTRFWRLEQVLLLVWLPVALAGGIFSLTWEAPQSHRAIGAIVPAVLLAGLPLGVLWHGVDQVLGALTSRRSAPSASVRRRWRAATAGLVVGTLATTGVANLDRFFLDQQQDARTWLEFSSAQTEAGRQIALLPPSMRIYLEPSWVNYPSILFLVPGERQYAPFDPATNLPITDDAAAVFIADRPAVAERIASLYPAAERTETRVSGTGAVAVYGFVLGPTVLQSNRGVEVVYQGAGGTATRREPAIDLDWPGGAPIAAPFDATWTTTLTVPTYGAYRVRLEGPPTLVLTLDGVELLRGGGEGLLRLPKGNHALRLAGSGLGDESVRLLWAALNEPLRPLPSRLLHVSPVETSGLLGRVYRGAEPSGDPVVEQVDPNVDLRVHFLPAPRPYTIEWTGAIRIARAGEYRFAVGSVGTSAIWIDGQQIAANSVPNGFADGAIDLSVGWHDIRVRFVDTVNFSAVTAFWQPPGGMREAIPTSVLRPWPAHRVVAARPEDGDIPVPTTALGDEAAPRLVPVTPPERARERREIGAGRVVTPSGALGQPRGLAVGPDGTIYVADAGRQAIVAVASDGTFRQLGEGRLKEPSAVAVRPDGSLAVVDAAAGRVVALDVNGKVGERLFPDHPLYGPRGLTVGPGGELVLADTGNDRLLVRGPDGVVTTVAGLSQPTGAVLLDDGTYLVAETGASQIVQVQADGKRLTTWTMPDSTTVIGPHVARLPDGGWVVSLPNERALLARPAGAAGAAIWTLGSGVRKPSGLAVGPDGLYVGDADAAAVRELSPP